MLSIKSVLYQIIVRIYLIENRICVGAFTCCEGYNFKILFHSPQKADSKWSYRYITLFISFLESDVNFHILFVISLF